MRNFIVSLICFVLVLCLWGGFSIYSAKMTNSLQDQSHYLAYTLIRKGEWISANKEYKKLDETWEDYKKYASFFLDSKEINEIDSTMNKAFLYMKAEDISNSSGEFSYLKEKFKLIHQNDSVTLSNLF